MKITFQILFVGFVLFLSSCKKEGMRDEEIIQQILTNISQINSAHYYSTVSAYNVLDTVKPVYKTSHFFKEYSNAADTFVGASYIRFSSMDTTKMEYCYDGMMRSRVHWEEGFFEIDSFKTQKTTWREVVAPFYKRAGTIFDYILNTEDSISYKISDFGDSLEIKLMICDTTNVVDFHISNRPLYFPQVHEMFEKDFS